MFAFCSQIQDKISIIHDPMTIFYVLRLKNKGQNGKYFSVSVMVLKNMTSLHFLSLDGMLKQR